MKNEAEKRNLHRIAKAPDFLEMWQGSENLHATQKESSAQNKQIISVGYILDMEAIVRASWSHLPSWWCGCIYIVRMISFATAFVCEESPWRINSCSKCPPNPKNQLASIPSDEDSAPESILDTEDWINWNGDLDNPNDGKDDCMADVESELEQDNSIGDPECPEQQDVSTAPNVSGLIQPTEKSKRQAANVLIMVNTIETRRNKGVKTM